MHASHLKIVPGKLEWMGNGVSMNIFRIENGQMIAGIKIKADHHLGIFTESKLILCIL